MNYGDPPKVISYVLAMELEENAPDADLSNKDNVMLLQDIKRQYWILKEESCLDHYFSMIYLLTNVAQVAPLPLKMLRTISTPYHI